MTMSARAEVRPREAASMIGCSVGYVYALLKDQTLSSRTIIRRNYSRGIRLITVRSIQDFLEKEVKREPGSTPQKQ
jgi:hypothetical protein